MRLSSTTMTLSISVHGLLLILLATTHAKEDKFLNQWIAEIYGGQEVAQNVARDLGFIYKGEVRPFEDHYEFAREGHPKVSSERSHGLTRSLLNHEQVKWAEQQWIVKRSPRGVVAESLENQPLREVEELFPSYYIVRGEDKGGAAKQGSFDTIPKNTIPTTQCDEASLSSYTGVTKHENLSSSLPSPYKNLFNDPLWQSQWYVQDYRTSHTPVLSLNVVPLYQKGITGKGVTVMVVDDGIIEDHPDLKGNFVDNISYNFCTDKKGCTPVVVDDQKLAHGTKCAGAIAMVADNKICGVGIAYNARVAGANVFCPESTSVLESKGLCHELIDVDIYSSSWGPQDDGVTMEDIGSMSAKAINKGITEGRKGKGSIYVFAAGNGRQNYDNCATDDSINFIGTIPITSASQSGKRTAYAERCAAIYATAYSGDGLTHEAITSTYVDGDCTTHFGGTSAAAPLASGIFALILQVNPELTYRDVMHLLAMTSEVAPLADNGDIWYKNGRGFWVSLEFGFGLINAENMANLAKDWKRVPEKTVCKIPIKLKSKEEMKLKTSKTIEIRTNTDECKDKILYLEEIELTSTIKYPFRGALKIDITSPSGTHSTLLEPRVFDNSTDGLCDWGIKSVHNWGEDPRGEWIIRVGSVSVPEARDVEGSVDKLTLTLHGTHEMPTHYKNPRTYSAFRLADGKTPWSK